MHDKSAATYLQALHCPCRIMTVQTKCCRAQLATQAVGAPHLSLLQTEQAQIKNHLWRTQLTLPAAAGQGGTHTGAL